MILVETYEIVVMVPPVMTSTNVLKVNTLVLRTPLATILSAHTLVNLPVRLVIVAME